MSNHNQYLPCIDCGTKGPFGPDEVGTHWQRCVRCFNRYLAQQRRRETAS